MGRQVALVVIAQLKSRHLKTAGWRGSPLLDTPLHTDSCCNARPLTSGKKRVKIIIMNEVCRNYYVQHLFVAQLKTQLWMVPWCDFRLSFD